MSQAPKTLILLAAAAIVPVVAAFAWYFFLPPLSHMNYGELIAPRRLPELRFALHDGGALNLSDLRGRWILLSADASACDDYCRHKLYLMWQVRAAQGVSNLNRVERLWILTDGGSPSPELIADYPGMRVVRGAQGLMASLPGDPHTAHIYLVDPMGNLMLKFPRNPEPTGMIHDLQRLLRVSRIG